MIHSIIHPHFELEWILNFEKGEEPVRLQGVNVLTRLPIVYLWSKNNNAWKNYENFLYENDHYLYFKIKPEYRAIWKSINPRDYYDHEIGYLDFYRKNQHRH